MKITKRLFLFSLIYLTAFQFSFGQVTFQKAYGGISFELGHYIIQLADSGYAIVGSTESYGMGSSDVYLIRINAIGDILWTRTYGNIGADDGCCIKQIFDGGFIISGYAPASSNGNYCYLIRTDSLGNLLWSKSYNGSIYPYDTDVNVTHDNGLIIASTIDNTANYETAYLIKTDSTGDSLWTRAYKIAGMNSTTAYEAKETLDGGFIVIGSTNDVITGNPDVLLFKTDSMGSIIWSKTFGGNGYDRGFAIQITSDGGYIIAGSTSSWGAGNTDLYLIKTDSIGNLQWSSAYGNLGFDFAMSVKQTNDLGYIVGGYLTDTSSGDYRAYFLKTDSIGNLIWSKVYGSNGQNKGYCVQPTFDNGYILVGVSYILGSGNYDVYLIKTDSMGNSGCYETNAPTIVGTTLTNQYNVAVYSVRGGIVETPVTFVSSGGISTNLCTSVGFNESSFNSQPTLSPNPTTGNFTITFPSTINKATIAIYNTIGSKLFSQNISNTNKANINLKNFEKGIYFVQMNEGEKQHFQKVIIE